MRLFHGFVLSRFANSRGYTKNKNTPSMERNIELFDSSNTSSSHPAWCWMRWSEKGESSHRIVSANKRNTLNILYIASSGAFKYSGIFAFRGGLGLELNTLEKRGLGVSGSGLRMMMSFGGSDIGREAVISLFVLLILLALLGWLKCRFYAMKASEIMLFH